MQFEIIYGCKDISNFKKQWFQLFDADKYEPSVSYEWTEALLETHISNEVFLIIILKNSDQIIGIIPLVLSRSKKYGLSILNLFPISEYYNTHSDLLIKEIEINLIKTFLRAIFDIKPKWDIFRINRLIEDHPFLNLLESYLKNSFKYKVRKGEPSFYLPLEQTYEDYLLKRSDKFRNYLRRMEKKLKKRGSMEFLKLHDFTNIEDAFNQILYVEEKSWKHKHGTAISSIERQKEFYRKLCNNTSERKWMHLSFLYLNKKPIAYNMGLLKNGIYYYLKTSFDEDFREVSPSTVLRAKLIKDLINEGIKEFDFPGEPYEWESQWTNKLRWHKSLLLYNNTLKAKLFSIYDDLKNRNEKFDGERQIKYHNPIFRP